MTKPSISDTRIRLRALARVVAIVCISASALVSCAASNFVTNIEQGNDIERVTRWMLVTEFRRLSTTPMGEALLGATDGDALIALSDDHSEVRNTRGKGARAKLVPAGRDWEVLRSMAARQSRFLSTGMCSRFVRGGVRKKGADEIAFEDVPDGLYHMFVEFQLSPGTLFMHGTVDLKAGQAACEDLEVLLPYSDEFDISLDVPIAD